MLSNLPLNFAIAVGLTLHMAATVTVSRTSVLFRWNEIASKLGHGGITVAVQGASAGALLSDVERVADQVLTQESQGVD